MRQRLYVGAHVLYYDWQGDIYPAWVERVHEQSAGQTGPSVDLVYLCCHSVMHATAHMYGDAAKDFWFWPGPLEESLGGEKPTAEEPAEEPAECRHEGQTATSSLRDGRLIKICCGCFAVLEEQDEAEASVLVRREVWLGNKT